MAPSHSPQKKSNATNWAAVIGALGACISLLLPISFMVWRSSLRHRVDANLKQIRDSGMPTSGTEINGWRPAPDRAENGAVILKEGFNSLQEFSSPKTKPIVLSDLFATNYWAQENLALLSGYVETNRTALSKIEEGLKFEKFTYTTDYSEGFTISLPHLSKIKAAANLLAAKAIVDLETSNEDAFANDVKQIVRLAETLNDESVMISWLVRTATIQIAVRSLERALNRKTISDKVGRDLEEAFARATSTNLLPNALIGERALAMPVFRASASQMQEYLGLSLKDLGGSVGIGLASTLGVMERDSRFYMEAMEESITLSAQKFPDSLLLTNRFEKIRTRSIKRGGLLSAMLLTSVDKHVIKNATVSAAVSSVKTALAVERFQNATGDFPETLSELGPNFIPPMDPFDGKPLRYRKQESGYVIYSVDFDGSDDGGAARKFGQLANGKTFDLRFKVHRPR